ncbi:MAG TPA: FtsX-like permease family protein [Rhizomicrobium sp.]|jgi:putative ABC transport system permease protein|nr:FtsX-like permease family protein [Rhizomicrobium sp.]
MSIFSQIWTVSVLNFKSLRMRFWQSMVIVAGLGVTIGVLLSMLSMTAGMKQAYFSAGSPDRAIVVSLGANGEGNSSLPRASAAVIMDAPGIARYKDGKPFADAGLNTNVPVLRLNGGRTNAVLRGFGDKGIALRPEFRLVSGRMFEPGKRELMVGVGAQTIYQHMQIGDKVIMPDGEWPIVGSFTTGDILDGQLIGDAATLMSATRHPNYNTVLIRLASRDSLATLSHALTTNPALSVTVMRHSDWYKMVSDLNTGFLSMLAYVVGFVMAIGALFGCLNTMYAAVSARRREIATLRALGYGAFPVAVSVVLEAMLLSAVGAMIGAAVAWALYNGHQTVWGVNIFVLAVPPGLIGLGIAWALMVALLGGLLPALGAARRPIAEALRAT